MLLRAKRVDSAAMSVSIIRPYAVSRLVDARFRNSASPPERLIFFPDDNRSKLAWSDLFDRDKLKEADLALALELSTIDMGEVIIKRANGKVGSREA